MSIRIGNKNKIKKSHIGHGRNSDSAINDKKSSFFEKHPVICSFLISLVAGMILLFSYFKKIVTYIEKIIASLF